MSAPEVIIRRAECLSDYQACQEAQRRTWGLREEGYVVPVATLVGAQLHGGLVLGAFLPDRSAAGLSFAFLGRIDGRIGLYSQLTGVVPEYQGRGLGERLKHAQRDFAREQGLDRIAWAFDPLQAGNAHFNLEKLGATAGRYIENMYGPRTDALNARVPTDRLIAVWKTCPNVPGRHRDSEAPNWPRLLEAAADGITPGTVCRDSLEAPAVLLEIPAEISRLRSEQPALAERWRRAVRDAFTAAFAEGFKAVGFVRGLPTHPEHCFYRLEQPTSEIQEGP